MANIYSITGKVVGNIELPTVFSTEYRPDLIQRAVVSEHSKSRQSYSTNPVAGLQTSADYFGNRRHTYRMTINRSQSRLPRIKPGGGGLGNVRRVPQSVGGRRAHPPRGKKYIKSLNKKEYQRALESAIATSSKADLVALRGHKIEKVLEMPLIVESKFEEIKKTKKATETLASLGLGSDLERSKKPSQQSGKAKSRGRPRRFKKSVLVVIEKDQGVKKALENIPGVDVCELKDLNVDLLAPGTHAGRMTLWTQNAIERLRK
ncbi:MAG: 50S ribosomal protein L4 [Candidatus Altiarchaeota archaeon]